VDALPSGAPTSGGTGGISRRSTTIWVTRTEVCTSGGVDARTDCQSTPSWARLDTRSAFA
jgi:hypothetical protein